jgi:hypothetical protein
VIKDVHRTTVNQETVKGMMESGVEEQGRGFSAGMASHLLGGHVGQGCGHEAAAMPAAATAVVSAAVT